jgi:hypothetical protein
MAAGRFGAHGGADERHRAATAGLTSCARPLDAELTSGAWPLDAELTSGAWPLHAAPTAPHGTNPGPVRSGIPA